MKKIEIFIVVLLTCGVLLGMFPKILVDPFYYFAADVSELYFPWWVYLNQSVRTQTYPPIRNPYWFMGSMPFASLENGSFYPPYILAQLFFDAKGDLDSAFLWLLGMQMAHYLLAAVAMYILMRDGLKLHKISSVFAGVVYATSGAFIGRLVHIPVILLLAWLPLLFWAYFRFVRDKKVVWAILSSFILAMITIAGHHQISYYIYGYFLLGIVYFTIKETHQRRLFFLYSMAIFLLTGLLTAPKVLLSIELSKQIVRTVAEMSVKSLYNSIHPLYYLTLIVPYLFGRHAVGYWGSDYPWGNWDTFIYVGIVPLFFLLVSLIWKNRSLLGFMILGLGASVLLSMGRFSKLSAVLNSNMPFAENLSLVSRHLDILHFFLTSLMGIGVHAVLTYPKGKLVRFLGVAGVLIVGTFLWWLKPSVLSMLQPVGRGPTSAEAVGFAMTSLALAKKLFIVSAAGVVLYILTRWRVIWFLLFIIFATDISKISRDFNPIEAAPGKPSVYFGDTADISLIRIDPGIFRINNLGPRNIGMVQNVESTYGYHTVETEAYHDIVYFIDFKNRALLNLLNIKYFLSGESLVDQDKLTYMGGNVWRNDSALERVTYVPGYQIKGKGEIIQSILLPDFLPRKTVLLDRYDVLSKNLSIYRAVGTADASVKIDSYSPEKTVVSFFSDQPGFLLYSEMQYPGWYAVVDGKKQDLLKADLSVYALPIEKGKHTVEFIYRSKPLMYGGWISASTILILGILFLSPRFRLFIKTPRV
ncbi:hypothetical protein A3D85_03130 [Candidatus Amesbacteria bacterium RIFCSPHIGHO2_02_FULL_47_9]|uniref:Membrane protein 6-pyruvoyl-tetrahydropterin synthase-related domain-containing protein n=1 Tax=Candidatus Amesbacteria bacterium RIFCSPHIGHO2_01_FULL_48_32b TaxID=1797253 RepID=A0A1F4YIJ5_9BACT|nr:MAG: hypothetical protein A2876_00755 [Candidatus Amesbacteria bacterium RIFCSPHIGHO2_01_FULL_48_32b]OGD02254.1 MAG: hypothetical protein A3D85_03130 [Candidatus Amesbacteria bacterium RIFCSPHIGHO2_02_FULL_47_9]OGD07453.1 MAG: hypothetical protein A2899_04080 [Candidatus Amesbacteria bacterium RIFCSPLOWO2_01_FULL_49_25]